MSKKLFDPRTWIWKKSFFGAPFDGFEKEPRVKEASSYFTMPVARTTPESRINAALLRAMQRLFLCDNEVFEVGGWAKTDDGKYIVQFAHLKGERIRELFNTLEGMTSANDSFTQVVYVPSTGRFFAAQVDEYGERKALKPDESITAFLAAVLLHAVDSDEEAEKMWKGFWTEQTKCLSGDENYEDETLIRCGCILSDNVYRRVTYYEQVNENHPGKGILVKLDDVDELKNSFFETVRIVKGSGSICGLDHPLSFENVSSSVKKTHERPQTIAELKGFYNLFPDRLLSPEEEALIPEVPDTYQITEQIYEICQMIKMSTELPTPMRNFLFVGGAGSGKTEAVKMIAHALGLPLLHQPCGVDTERFDIAQQVIPDGSGGFKYVMGPMMQACQKGYVCEISEADLILKQGTLGEFNPLLDKTGTYPLSTGEIVKRHPDAVLIFTMNGDYEGCRNINQAVRNRCKVYMFDTPSDEELIERVANESGFEDRETIAKMVMVYHGIREFCETNSVTDGAVGVRNLINWASATAINGRVWHNAYSSMVLGATFDKEVHEDLINCVNTQFDPEEVRLPC